MPHLTRINVISLLEKIDQIRLLMGNSNIDIFTVSETWLRPHLNTPLVSLGNYKVYRLDRGAKTKRRKRGGGLITYVNQKHAASCENLEELDIRCHFDADMKDYIVKEINKCLTRM